MIFANWKIVRFNPQSSAIFFKGKTPQLWYCYKKKQVYWVELSFALCSLPIFTTRSFKTVSFSAPSSPNLIFFWGLGLLASSFTTVNNQPAKLFFPPLFCRYFLQRDMKNTWNYGLAQKHFVVDPDFCGDHQWTCPGRQWYVNTYFFPFDKSTRRFHEKIMNFVVARARDLLKWKCAK